MKAFFRFIVFLFFYWILTPLELFTEQNSGESVKINVGNIQMEADHVSFQNQTAHVSGHVHIAGENFYAKCDDVDYHVSSKDIHAKGVEMSIDRAYVSAQKASFTQNQIAIEDADVGINFGFSHLIPHIQAHTITYNRQEKKGVARSTFFKLGKIPLMGLPYLAVGDWMRFIEMNLDGGHTSKLGGYLQSEITYNIYEDLYLGMLLDIYAKRGVLLGPVLKINSDNENIQSHLKMQSGFITDHGERGKDIDGNLIVKNRWFVDMKQNTHLGQDIDLFSDFVGASDGSIEKDFRPNLYENEDIRDSFGEFDYRGENYLLTAFTRLRMNPYQDFPQQIPSLRFERFPQEITDLGIYYFGYIDFTRQKWKQEKINYPGQTEAIELNRVDSYFGINRPTELAKGIHFTPLVGGKWTCYCGEYDRFLGELGIDFDANFYATRRKSIPGLKIAEWKHVVRPIVKYRFIPKLNRSHSHRAIETKKKNEFLPILDLSEMRNIDDLQEQSVLRLGLENDFFAKNDSGKIRKIGSFDFYQDLRFRRITDIENKKESFLSDFYILSEFNPRRWLNFEIYTRHNWQKISFEEIQTKVNFISGDLWNIGFSTKFRKHRSQQLGIDFSFHLNEISHLHLETKIDVKHGRFLSTEIAYTTRLGGVWDMQLFCKIKNHSSRSGRFQSGFSINLMRW
ncbi:MAG: hypothetical protein LBS71_02565 [Puniceicoccales bacterium]|nr:hypothetical protein [Puniceicoccales bacterium]